MKKSSFLLLCIVLLFAVCSAQTVSQQQNSLVIMQTGTWCTHCGVWGNGVQQRMDSALNDKAVFMELHYNDIYSNLLYPIDTVMLNNFMFLTGGTPVPGWFVNDFAYSNGNPQQLFDNMKNRIDYNFNQPAKVGIGYTYNFNPQSNSLQINAKVKFFEATTGDYYLNFYIVKDSIYDYQNGAGYKYLRNILARAVYEQDAVGVWGKLVASGSINSGQEFTNYNITYNDTIVSSKNVHLIGVIWQQVEEIGMKLYNPINVVQQLSLATGTGDLVAGNTQIDLFPNPTTEKALLQLQTETALVNTSVTLLDVNGRQVKNVYTGTLMPGGHQIPIDIAGLQSGVYLVQVLSQGEQLTKKLVIAK